MDFSFLGQQNSGISVGGGGGSSRDPRFITYDKKGNKNGPNIVHGAFSGFILPSCGNFRHLQKNGWQGYQLPNFYARVAVRLSGQQYPDYFRVSKTEENFITKAFWKLYRALNPQGTPFKGSKMEAIKDAGFNGGVDFRMVYNVAMVANNQISDVLWLDCVTLPDSKVDEPEAEKKFGIKILRALMSACNQAQKPLFVPEHAIGFEFGVGDIAIDSVQIASTQNGWVIQDISSSFPDTPEVFQKLDASREWCDKLDNLPQLTDIPAITENGEACEILGLSTSGATPANSQGTGFGQGQVNTSAGLAAAAGAATTQGGGLAAPPQGAQAQSGFGGQQAAPQGDPSVQQSFPQGNFSGGQAQPGQQSGVQGNFAGQTEVVNQGAAVGQQAAGFGQQAAPVEQQSAPLQSQAAPANATPPQGAQVVQDNGQPSYEAADPAQAASAADDFMNQLSNQQAQG